VIPAFELRRPSCLGLGSRLNWSKPSYDSGDIDGRFEVARQLVVACGDAAPILEPAKHALDPVAQFIGVGVEGMGSLSRRVVRDDRDGPAAAQEEAKAVTVVSGIGGA
jgi:hypothetical protein